MEKIRVLWSRDALRDLDEAYEYISRDSPTSAKGIIERIEILLESLSAHPKLGRIGRVKGTRELVVTGTPFILPYVIDKDDGGKERIIILGVRHASRRWPGGFS